MKKIIFRLLIVLVILLAVFAIGVHVYLDGVIKRGIETFGPKFTKVEVKLSSVKLSLLSGSGEITGFILGNPEGFKTASAISVGSTSVSLKPESLLSDKIVIREFTLKAPEITFETGLNVKENNLSKILANLEETTGGGGTPPTPPAQKEPSPPSTNEPAQPAPKDPTQPAPKGPARKLEVDSFIISGGKVHVTVSALGGKSATMPLPEIRLKDLGTGPEGITGAELSKRALRAIEEKAAEVALVALADLSKGAVYMSKDVGPAGTNALDKATKGIGDWFKKK